MSTFVCLRWCLSASSFRRFGYLFFSYSKWCFNGQTCCKIYIISKGGMRIFYEGKSSMVCGHLYIFLCAYKIVYFFRRNCALLLYWFSLKMRWIVGVDHLLMWSRIYGSLWLQLNRGPMLVNLKGLQNLKVDYLILPDTNVWNASMIYQYFY